jgi:hypothetical protein
VSDLVVHKPDCRLVHPSWSNEPGDHDPPTRTAFELTTGTMPVHIPLGPQALGVWVGPVVIWAGGGGEWIAGFGALGGVQAVR